MATTEPYSRDLLVGNYLVGGKVYLKNGEIKSNPFSKAIRKSLATEWLISNEWQAKAKIRELMRSQGLGIHEVDECYDYAVSYFLENEDRDFDKDYFGKDSSDTYRIDIYCLFQLKMIVYSYRNEMKTRLKKTVHLVDSDKEHTDSLPKNCISYNVLKRESDGDDGSYTLNDIVEFEELQFLLDVEVPKFDKKFKLVGLHDFHFRDYIYYMFLDDTVERQLAASQLQKSSSKEIAAKMGQSPVWLSKINRIIRDLMLNRKDFFGNVPSIIASLVNGKARGWEPSYTPIYDRTKKGRVNYATRK